MQATGKAGVEVRRRDLARAIGEIASNVAIYNTHSLCERASLLSDSVATLEDA